jgi:hypothetical protein
VCTSSGAHVGSSSSSSSIQGLPCRCVCCAASGNLSHKQLMQLRRAHSLHMQTLLSVRVCPCRAQAAGFNKQLVQLLNPVNEKEVNFLATEAMDYPCRCGDNLTPSREQSVWGAPPDPFCSCWGAGPFTPTQSDLHNCPPMGPPPHPHPRTHTLLQHTTYQHTHTRSCTFADPLIPLPMQQHEGV